MLDMDEQPRKIAPAQWYVVALIVAFAAGSALYKLLRHEQLGHSAAMFLGIPAVLAVVLALAPKAKSVTGGILKGITLALLVIAPLLGEGYLCILVASPLFYLVGIVVGLMVDRQRRKGIASLSCTAVLVLPMCCEGVFPQLTFNRIQSVVVHRVVDVPASLVEDRLTKSSDVNTPLPLTLRIGFPRPLWAHGEGLTIGDTRTIHFAGAEGNRPGNLLMRITERRPGYARFATVSDGSKVSRWVRWTGSEVEWKPLDYGHTEVTWRITFERQLDPAWYFNPWEKVVVKDAARYLIEANATPTGSN
jgi:hypothetical protein